MNRHERTDALELEQPKIWYPNQRVIRTVVTALIGLVAPLVAVLGILFQAWPLPWLGAALGFMIVVQGVVAKLMANEAINAWLIANSWIGSEPKGSSK